MTLRLKCRSCGTAFVTHDDPGVQPAVCPKCGAKHVARKPAAAASTPAPMLTATAVVSPEPAGSVFVPAGEPKKRGRGRGIAVILVTLLAIAGVALAVAWPRLKAWWKPVPLDPVESVAASYLKALAEGDSEAAHRLGTVDLPPAIRTYRSVRHEKAEDSRLKGSFAPLTAFNANINRDYEYDASAHRFTPRNALGPAAEVLDALHAAKEKNEKEGLDKKITSGNPEDIFDAAEMLAKPLAALSETILAPRKIVPTYGMLVADAKPPLPASEKQLALDFDQNRETWDALLKRPFLTLKADGPFLLERAEVTARVVDALGSSGDPPTTLHLTMTRFRLEGIDTGWKVTSTRRAGQPAPAPATPTSITPPATDPSHSTRPWPAAEETATPR